MQWAVITCFFLIFNFCPFKFKVLVSLARLSLFSNRYALWTFEIRQGPTLIMTDTFPMLRLKDHFLSTPKQSSVSYFLIYNFAVYVAGLFCTLEPVFSFPSICYSRAVKKPSPPCAEFDDCLVLDLQLIALPRSPPGKQQATGRASCCSSYTEWEQIEFKFEQGYLSSI